MLLEVKMRISWDFRIHPELLKLFPESRPFNSRFTHILLLPLSSQSFSVSLFKKFKRSCLFFSITSTSTNSSRSSAMFPNSFLITSLISQRSSHKREPVCSCMVVPLSGGDLDNGFRSWRDLERVLEGVSRESRDVSQEYWIFGNRCTMKYFKDCLRNSSSKRGYGFVQNTLSIVNLTLDNIVQNSWKKFYSVLKLKQIPTVFTMLVIEHY